MLLGTLGAVASSGCSVDEPLDAMRRRALEAPRDLGPPKRVFAKRFVAPIRDAPKSEGARIGYLRAGALLHSTTTEPLGYEGCEGGWYELDSGGYVCSERDVIVFSGESLPELRARQPDRSAVMPYDYVTVRRKTPLYKRIPKVEEVYVIPPDLEPDAGTDADAVAPTIDNPLVLRVLRPGFYVSLDRSFERDGQVYWRTQQNGFISEDALRRKPWSDFRGQELGSQRPWTLPVAVTRSDETVAYRLNERGKLRTTRDRLPRRTWLPVRARRRIGDLAYLDVGEGRLVSEADVLVVRPTAPPEGIAEGERSIDIESHASGLGGLRLEAAALRHIGVNGPSENA